VRALLDHLLEAMGPELGILLEADLEDILRAGDSRLRLAVERCRTGHLHLEGGFDGEFGVVRVFSPEDAKRLNRPRVLFAMPEPEHRAAGPAGTSETGSHAGPLFLRPPPFGSMELETGGPSPVAPAPAMETTASAGEAPGLNELQKAAVEAPFGPCIVVAGPGTGKTRVLTHRLAHLVEAGEPPSSIAALTFTRKAAGEMRERAEALLGGRERLAGAFVGTIHGFCLQLLTAAREKLGEVPLTVCSPFDRRELVEELLALHPDLGTPRRVNELLEQHLGRPEAELTAEMRAVVKGYHQLLARWNLVDLSGIIPAALDLLAKSAPETTGGLRHLLIDEFQDIDERQYELVRRLGRRAGDLLVIGDPNQSIYGFRGASPRFFDIFQEEFKARRIVLQASYRSTAEIRTAAGMLLGLERWSSSLGARAEHVVLAPAPTAPAEAEYVAHTVERLVGGTASFSFNSDRVEGWADEECSFGDIAILTRTAFAADGLEEALVRLGVPLSRPATPPEELLSMQRTFEAALRYTANPGDRLAARRLDRFARQMTRAGRTLSLSRLCGRVRRNAAGPPEQVLQCLFTHAYPPPVSVEERVLFERLSRSLGRGEEGDLVHRLATMREDELAPVQAQQVSLLTMHGAKGLEFDVVFVCGLEEGLVPYRHADGEEDQEEERRLLYVALTRARKRLFLTHARKRRVFGITVENRPSRFLAEIEDRLMRARRPERAGSRPRVEKPPPRSLF